MEIVKVIVENIPIGTYHNILYDPDMNGFQSVNIKSMHNSIYKVNYRYNVAK